MTMDQCVSRKADSKVSGHGCLAKGVPEDVNTAVQENLPLFLSSTRPYFPLATEMESKRTMPTFTGDMLLKECRLFLT